VKWQPDWQQAKQHLIGWWDHKDMVTWVACPSSTPLEVLPDPAKPADLTACYTDAQYRLASQEYHMANTRWGGDAFPIFSTMIGPGSLGTFLGAEPVFEPNTVWYKPCIDDPDNSGPIRFDPSNNKWWDIHLALIREGVAHADGRYKVGLPDMIENLDTLAALRDTEELMFDLVERPAWVQQRLAEINQAFFDSFDLLFDEVADEDGGNVFTAFSVWGPGKTAKLQCDISCMFSPAMFDEFVLPHLTNQCDWLDYSLYHLDGEDALQHLDSLLGIESLNGIEWTSKGAYGGNPESPSGGSPHWYDLYRRIKAGGKSVQAVQLRPDEVVPLLDAVGPKGMYIEVRPEDEASLEKVLRDIEQYR